MQISYSQLNTFSPYTRHGIGEEVSFGSAKKRAMGGMGAGYRAHNYIDFENPATYTSQDTMSFILDIGIAGKYVDYSTTAANIDRLNFNFEHLILGFPVTRWMKMSAGLKPYSYVGFELMESYSNIDTSLQINYYYNGSGGINQFFIGNAIEIKNKVSIGLNFNYLFGTIQQSNQIYPNLSESFITHIETKYIVSDVLLNYGLQFYDNITDNLRFTLGLTHQPNFNIKYRSDSLISISSSSIYDTLLYSYDNQYSFKMPQKLIAGFSLIYKEKLTIGFEYSHQNWADCNFRNTEDYLSSGYMLRLGAEYIPNKYSAKRYTDHIQYRFGAHFGNYNLKINNTQLAGKGLSCGFGFPFKSDASLFNISFEYGQKGTIENELINENYFITTFNLTLYDIWFYKRKID